MAALGAVPKRKEGVREGTELAVEGEASPSPRLSLSLGTWAYPPTTPPLPPFSSLLCSKGGGGGPAPKAPAGNRAGGARQAGRTLGRGHRGAQGVL